MNQNNEQYDVAIVGSGPGGSVTAFHLSKNGFRVIVLEEGEKHDASAFSLQEVREKYRNAGLTAAFGKPTISYIEGKCLGGGSDVNSGLYQRCSEEILQQWEKDYQVDNLIPSMQEQFEQLQQEFHTGESLTPNAAAEKLRLGAEHLGWKWSNVPRLSRSKTMRETYLSMAEKQGCEIACGIRVDKLVYKANSGWVLVSRTKNHKFKVNARAVFVCAGAIQTPALLLRSGIANNVGKSLALHPTAKIVAEFPDDLIGSIEGPGTVQIKEFAPDLTMGCSVSTPPFLAATLTIHSEKMKELPIRYKKMATYYAMVRGANIGRVRVFPGLQDPVVSYRMPVEQMAQLYEGTQKLTHLLQSIGVNKVYRPYRGQDPRRMRIATYHLFGTVPCGEKKSLCAADSYGAIYGYSNLFVSDASLFCTAPGVNPQATIMAMARRNALHFIASNPNRF